MITLKDALTIVELFQKAYLDGDYKAGYGLHLREKELRTKLARAIAQDNPELNPNCPKDLLRVAELPKSTILSGSAESIFREYANFLQKEFGIKVPSKITVTDNPAFKSFSDIRKVFLSLRKQSSAGQATSWRPEELTSFHRLCVRLGRDNNMSTNEIMSGFTGFTDLKINEASIYLAERLFETMRT